MHFSSDVSPHDALPSWSPAWSPKGSRAIRVAIIGGGFSGIATAIQLLRRTHPFGLELWLIEKSEKLAGGLAYGSERTTDLLNVPAERMSVLDSEPEHFVRWLRRSTGLNPREEVHFAPRTQYRRYLNETLQEAAASWPSRNHLHRILGEVVDLQRVVDSGEWRLQLANGSELLVDAVVLALGWQGSRTIPQFTPEVQTAPGFIPNSWQPQTLERIEAEQSVLVVGTGLSMFDTVLSLQARGHRGKVVALSRRGLMPQPHAPNGRHHLDPELVEWVTTPETGRLGQKLKRLRAEIRAQRPASRNWRALIAALRPLTPQIWQAWTAAEKSRFQRHYSTFWDIHRHRCAPQSWSRVQEWIDAGQLSVLAARIQSIQVAPNGLDVRWLPRGAPKTAEYKATFQAIINCLGPSTSLQTSPQPLVRQLLSAELIAPDSSGLGIDCSDDLQVISARGNRLNGLFVVGPMLRGKFGEATAVPELRHHASLVASQIVKHSRQERGWSHPNSGTRPNNHSRRSGTG
jgi:uncharacterized NAD(P)/FAD-binding protein YdhS